MNVFRIIGKKFQSQMSGDQIAGRSITIRNGVVSVDGKTIGAIEDNTVTIRVEGVIENLTTDLSVVCQNVTGNVRAGMSATCGDVGGDVRADMSVNCDTVHGNVEAGMTANTGKVLGSVRSGM